MRREEILGWLGRQLKLTWAQTSPAPAVNAEGLTDAVADVSSVTDFEPLLAHVRLGYTRGVVQWLDRWVAREPAQAVLASQWRQLAREFRFEAIEQAVVRHVRT